MNLYEITQEEKKLNELFELVETEEDNDAVVQLLEEITLELTKKSSNIIKARTYTRNTIENLDNEIKRLSEYKRHLEKREKSFSNYVVKCMQAIGIKKIETPLGVLSLRTSPGSLIIDDEKKIPANYYSQEVVYRLEKNKVKSDIKNGVAVEGAHIEKNTNLVIK